MSPATKFEKNERKRKKKSTRPHEESRSFATLVQSALFGAFIGLLTAAVLSLGATLLCYRSDDPKAYLTPLSLFVLYLSSLVSGFAALKRHRTSALLCGGMAGLALAFFFLVLSFFLQDSVEATFSPILSWALRLLMLPTAAVGGFLGMGKAKKRRS